MVADHELAAGGAVGGHELLGDGHGRGEGLLDEDGQAGAEQLGQDDAVAGELLRGHEAVERLAPDHLLDAGVGARHGEAGGDARREGGAQLGEGDDLAVRQRGVIAEVGGLAHFPDSDETDPKLGRFHG